MSFKRCVGCEEPVQKDEATKVEGLGLVCPYCMEVIDIVWEVEIERTREACATIEQFIEDLNEGRI